jgi:hypothetical protein
LPKIFREDNILTFESTTVPVHGSYVTVYEGDWMIRDIRFTGKPGNRNQRINRGEALDAVYNQNEVEQKLGKISAKCFI